MADIVKFPDVSGNEETFELGGGAKVTLKTYDGEPLTLERSIYMLEYVKSLILRMAE